MPFYENMFPDGNIAVSANYVIEAGNGAPTPANKWEALADDYPKEGEITGPGIAYTRLAIALALLDVARFSTNNPGTTLGTETRCEAVRIVGHCQTLGGSILLQFGNGPQNTEIMGDTGFGGDNVQAITAGPWATQAMGASVGTFQEWTQTDLNDVRLKQITAGTNALGAAWMYRIWLQKRLIARPRALISSPAQGSTVTTLNPRITWNQSNLGRAAEPQKEFVVRVYDKAFVDAVSDVSTFDPETQPPLWEKMSFSSANFVDVAGGLDYGKQYTAFVKVATTFNGVAWYGPWSPRKDFFTQSRPVVVAVAPTGTIIDTARPEIQWTWFDADGDKQSSYEVMIHKRPGASWPANYDPESPLHELDMKYHSGKVGSSDLEHTIPVNLENSTVYRAYVKAAHSLPVFLESDWSFIEFTTGFSSPMAPTISAVEGGDRALLTVTPATPSATNKGMTVGNGWAETPDNAALDHTTDFEYVFEVAMLDWTPPSESVIAAKGSMSEGDGAWVFSVMPDGKFKLVTSQDGTAGPTKTFLATTLPGLTAGQRRFIKFTHDNNTPAGSTTVTFAHSATNGSFVTIGTPPVVAGIQNVFNSGAPLRLGARGSLGLNTWQGYFYYAEGRSSIGGTIVTSPTFTGLPLGNAPFTDAQGRTYTFKGDAEVEYKENPNADAFDIQRSLDGGTTWEYFRVEHRVNRRALGKSGFEDTTTVWDILNTSCTVTNSADVARTGSRSLKMVRAGGGGNIEVADYSLAATTNVAVAGEEIEDGLWVWSPVSRAAIIEIDWVNGSNALISTSSGAFVLTVANDWTFVSARGIAPTNTVKWRARFTLTAFPGSIPAGETHYIDDADGYISTDKSWLTVTSENLPKTVSPFLAVDHEVPFDAVVVYRAQAKTFGLGTEISSPVSANDSMTLHENRVWLKSITDPRLNQTYKTQDRWMQRSHRRNRQVYEPIGRSNPIVIKHAASHDRFRLNLLLMGQIARNDMDAILTSNHTMFIQSPKGNWWAEIANDTSESDSLWDDLRGEQDAWTVSLDFQEVDR